MSQKSIVWKNVVLSAYPKVMFSPEREIAGLGAIIDKHQGHLRPLAFIKEKKQQKPRPKK